MSINVIPVIRNDKKDAKGLVPIYLFMYEGNHLKAKISIGQKIEVDGWNSEERKVKRKATNAALINGLIEKTIAELKAKILAEQIVSKQVDVKLLLRRERIKDACFYEFAETQIKEKNYADETRRAYRIYIDKLKGFKKTLRLREINYQFLQRYEAYLRDELKNQHNTIWGNMKFINTMTNDAIKCNYLAIDPFKTYIRPKYKQTERTFLTGSELAAIEKEVNETQDPGLHIIGKYFLFMALTGLRYSDAIRFKSWLHVIDGERIVIETRKTGKITNLLINDKIKPLIPFLDNNGLSITQTDFNRKLKLIAAGAGVKKKVSSHVARHSFGSSLADLDIPVEVAKGLLAHGSTNSTKIYYHLKSSNLDAAMRKFNSWTKGTD
jgi:integrase/recombinase XerD